MPMEKVGKFNAISKNEFHLRLRKWFNSLDEVAVGPDETQQVVINDQSNFYGFHANTKRAGVEPYLALVLKHGEALEWVAVKSQRGKQSRIHYGPEKVRIKLFSLHLLPESRKVQDNQISTNDADETPAPETCELTARQHVLQQILRRQGQPKFRDALRKRYHDTCIVTGCKIVDLLEAAHIRTMPGVDDNSPENGLLLRADIHTLFDLNLLRIEPDSLLVCLHPGIAKSEYAPYAGTTLRVITKDAPSRDALRDRKKAFG